MGRARSAAVEVGAALCAGGAGWAAGHALLSAGPGGRLAIAGALGAAIAAGELGLLILSGRTGRSAVVGGPAGVHAELVEARRYLAECAATGVGTPDRLARLTEGLGMLLAEAADLREVALVRTDEAHASTIDPRVRTWLAVNRAPVSARHLDALSLGGLRQPVTEFVRGLGADLIVPLVHRERLVGVATARGAAGRALRGARGAAVMLVQEAAAAAVGELLLRAQVEQRAEMTREVETAASVQRDAAAGTTIDEMAGCRVVRTYAPGRQLSGAWWSAHALPDGRLFVAMGEVTARGVPAALLSGTALGVCEAATSALGAGVEIHGLLELLHRAIAAAGGGQYAMSCVVALVDAAGREVSFASAGHPFPYLCRPWMGAGARGALRAMVSRGALIGGEDGPVHSQATQSLAPGDVMLFFTSSLTDARDPDGETFGERRLQHILRRASLIGPTGPDGSEVADQIGEQVLAHAADRGLEEAVVVASVEVRP